MQKLNRKTLRAMADSSGFIYKPNANKPILHISDDGTIIRADIRLDLCKAMTLKEANQLLRSV